MKEGFTYEFQSVTSYYVSYGNYGLDVTYKISTIDKKHSGTKAIRLYNFGS